MSRQKSSRIKLLATIALIIVIVSLTAVAAKYMLTPPTQQPNTELPDLTLTLIGADGQYKNLTKADILALESYMGRGGIKSHGNQISGVGNYTGVPVSTLIQLIGGMKSDQTLTAKAADNYIMTYSYNQVINGQDILTYDALTGSQTTATQPAKLVLSYYRDGVALPSDEGPLRMSVLGNEGFITQGNIWAKWVVELKINPNPYSNPEPTDMPTSVPSKTTTPTPANPSTNSPTSTPAPTSTTTPAPSADTLLTVIGVEGAHVSLTLNDLLGLTTYSANGGIKSGSGLSNYGKYTGIPILTICNLVGGINSSNTVKVTASDSYTSTYTYSQVNGQDIPMYDQNQNAATPTHSLTVIVAYHYNDTALPNDPGPLRVIAVGPEGYYMQGNLSPKMVVKIEIL
ncbi:MAG: molybdopterin-dependent oxidoreductase [Candidatus Bathyarchaeota archaeon]|nr:molybdopterin-dependent oxidoreductase [Candidatus Bathyarchaeota archaeon]